MHLPPTITEIYSDGGPTASQVMACASWHQERADNDRLSDLVRERHSLIAFRLFRVAASAPTNLPLAA